MDRINLFFFIPIVLIIVLLVINLLTGKNDTKKNPVYKYSSLIVLLSFITSIVTISYYYEQQFDSEIKKINDLLTTTKINDSVYTSHENRKRAIDSLNRINKELEQLLENLKTQEKIVGKKIELKKNIKNKIKGNVTEIGEIEKYNEILDNSRDKRKGYVTHGETSNFIFNCPTDFKSDYIDLKIRFQDDKLINKIEFIFVTFSKIVTENQYNSLSSQIYLPQSGVNAFKVKNYFKEPKVVLEIGYVLKSDKDKSSPNVERIVCKN